MNRLKNIIINSLLTLIISVSLLATVFVLHNTQVLPADTTQIAKAAEQTSYLPLTDAPPYRNIAGQTFAPQP